MGANIQALSTEELMRMKAGGSMPPAGIEGISTEDLMRMAGTRQNLSYHFHHNLQFQLVLVQLEFQHIPLLNQSLVPIYGFQLEHSSLFLSCAQHKLSAYHTCGEVKENLSYSSAQQLGEMKYQKKDFDQQLYGPYFALPIQKSPKQFFLPFLYFGQLSLPY